MWPKVLTQLFELLPHISRMVPLADRYLSARSSTDTAVTTLAEGVRTDMGRVAKAHVDLANRLDEFAAHVSESAAEARKARLATESIEVRLGRLEKTSASLRTLLFAVACLLAIALVLLVVLLLRSHA